MPGGFTSIFSSALSLKIDFSWFLEMVYRKNCFGRPKHLRHFVFKERIQKMLFKMKEINQNLLSLVKLNQIFNFLVKREDWIKTQLYIGFFLSPLDGLQLLPVKAPECSKNSGYPSTLVDYFSMPCICQDMKINVIVPVSTYLSNHKM